MLSPSWLIAFSTAPWWVAAFSFKLHFTWPADVLCSCMLFSLKTGEPTIKLPPFSYFLHIWQYIRILLAAFTVSFSPSLVLSSVSATYSYFSFCGRIEKTSQLKSPAKVFRITLQNPLCVKHSARPIPSKYAAVVSRPRGCCHTTRHLSLRIAYHLEVTLQHCELRC